MVRGALLVLLAIAGAGAQELVVSGPVPAVVQLGGRAVVTLTVLGVADDAGLGRLPVVDGLEILAGRPMPTTAEIPIEGRPTLRRGLCWKIELEPGRAGVFDLPPFKVEAGGQTLSSGPLHLEAIRDAAADAYAFVETSVPRRTWIVGEVIPLRLRVGIERAFASSQLVPMFRQRLDLPVQLQARWLTGLPGALAPPEDAPGGASFVLNDEVTRARPRDDRLVDGRRFMVLELERFFLAETPGELVIPEPLLRFAYATQFRDDFINGRVPVDRVEAVVAGPRIVVRIDPLPDAGRPAVFSGVVGRFEMRAEAHPRELSVGQSFRLVLHISGEGSLERLVPPVLGRQQGFHVYGTAVNGGGGHRTVTYDLAPLDASVREVPPIELAYYDPAPPAGYRRARTGAIPLRVRARPGASPAASPARDLGGGPIAGKDDIFDIRGANPRARTPSPRALAPWELGGALAAPWLLALGLVFWLRARDRHRGDPAQVRARRAAATFRARLRAPDAALAPALAAYLAARLHCSSAAVVAPDLGDRVRGAGLSSDLAARATTLLEGLVSAGYGGVEPEDAPRAARDLVEDLEAAFRELEASR